MFQLLSDLFHVLLFVAATNRVDDFKGIESSGLTSQLIPNSSEVSTSLLVVRVLNPDCHCFTISIVIYIATYKDLNSQGSILYDVMIDGYLVMQASVYKIFL